MGVDPEKMAEMRRRSRVELAHWQHASNARPLDNNALDMSVAPDPTPCACPFYHVYGRCKMESPYTKGAKRRRRRLGPRPTLEQLAARVQAEHDEEGRDHACWVV